MLAIKLALLISIANGAPLLAKRLMGSAGAQPIDGGRVLQDQQPLFGHTKTWRGLGASFCLTLLACAILALPWTLGVVVAFGAMAGDLFTSYYKRRLGFDSSSKCLGLDQIPESFLPAFLACVFFGFSWQAVIVATGVFVLGDILFSPLWYKLGWRSVPH